MTIKTLLLCLALGQANVPVRNQADAPEIETPEARRFHEIDRDIMVAIRQANAAKSDDERALAVYDLVDLHREIVGHPRFVESDVLKEYRNRVASPLIRIRTELSKRKRDLRPSGVPSESQKVREALGEQMSLTAHSLGGPLQMLLAGRPRTESSTNKGHAGGAGRADGQSLIDLIQRTIRPEFWDVNGGPGSMVYWDAWHCLVVRATAEVHHQIGGLNGALRQ